LERERECLVFTEDWDQDSFPGRKTHPANDLNISLLSNAFYLADTKGIPLAMQMTLAHERGAMVSLLDFYCDAIQAGWSHEKAASKINEACLEVFGKVPKGVF
jgi:hypothetical protein